jgi:hypothetical protein
LDFILWEFLHEVAKSPDGVLCPEISAVGACIRNLRDDFSSQNAIVLTLLDFCRVFRRVKVVFFLDGFFVRVGDMVRMMGGILSPVPVEHIDEKWFVWDHSHELIDPESMAKGLADLHDFRKSANGYETKDGAEVIWPEVLYIHSDRLG